MANNLPLPLTSFVGRAGALAEVQRLLSSARLITLTGPGGVGKTRLALEAASAAVGQFEDGAWWVELAPLCDAGLVADEVSLVLGLPAGSKQPQKALVSEHLRPKNLLLVLDNCEHLIYACAELAESLLQTCPRLRILATSREALGIGGEIAWPVPPLSLPGPGSPPNLEAVTESEAGRLFVERARAIRPDLPLAPSDARAIAQVCRRLDGLPLAIELAAARVRMLSLPQIAARLDDSIRLLTQGSRTALPRHQTLEAAMDWSYDLLTLAEQELFKRLAIFSRGFTLEAAEAVASDPAAPEVIPPEDVLDLLSRLVLKSLVVVMDDRAGRYRLLETIRQHALERLRASGEMDRVRHLHLAYYLELAERAESRLVGENQVESLKLLQVEHDNLRAALAWAAEGGAPGAGLRLAAALGPFWNRIGHLSEGSRWLEKALAACRAPGPLRAKALYQAASLAHQQGNYEQALDLSRQSLALSRYLGDRHGMARALGLRGMIVHWQGDRDRAGPLLEESLALAREIEDERTVARTLLFLGDLRLRQGALAGATALLEDGLGFYQRMGDGWRMAWALSALGDVARLRGDYRRAAAHFRLALSLYQELGSKSEMPFPLEALALTTAAQGQPERAARLWGAAAALRDEIHAFLAPSYRSDYAPYLDLLRAALGEQAFAAALAEGRELTLEQALALADSPAEPAMTPGTPASTQSSPHAPAHPLHHGLTPREVEVLRLLASGLTDAQIADKLVISPRTVGKHLQSIYSKLYFPSRSAATRWAIEHHLA